MTSKAKILVVEDEPAVAGLMTFLLTREGYDVQTVFTGKAGMELATTRKFDSCPVGRKFAGHERF